MNPTVTVAANDFKTWMEELGAWFYDFFHPELEGYVNFDFGGGNLINIQVIVFGIFIGVFIASLYMVYVKTIVGAFVRKLLAEQCLSEEKAKTLEELGFSRNLFVRHALRGSLLASTVSRVEPSDGERAAETDAKAPTTPSEEKGSKAEEDETPADTEEKGTAVTSAPEEATAETAERSSNSPETTRYYIKEAKKYAAEMRFNARGSGVPTLLFVLLISVICIFVIFAFLPQILRFVDNTISIFSVKGNTIQ